MEKSSKIRLNRIRQMTNGRGIYQHSKGVMMDPFFGYALDDQARALMVAKDLGEKDLAEIYLNFIKDAYINGEWYQFFYEDKRGWEKGCSEDALGYTLWALLKSGEEGELVDDLIRRLRDSESPRPTAISLLAMADKKMEEKLVDFYKKNSSDDWQWFEDNLAYGNALMPWALWLRGYGEIAQKTTKFLLEVCQENGVPSPIGNKDWYKRGGIASPYDQQPVEACYMVGCLKAAGMEREANNWLEWFKGYNINNLSLIDENGGCYDALTVNGVNKNQGAESNICWAWVQLMMERKV